MNLASWPAEGTRVGEGVKTERDVFVHGKVCSGAGCVHVCVTVCQCECRWLRVHEHLRVCASVWGHV